MITFEKWKNCYLKFQEWIESQGFPESLVSSVVQSRIKVLNDVVTGFDQFAKYIQTSDQADFPAVPPLDVVLPGWYQSLRRNHESNGSWPTELSNELERWINQQSLPDTLSGLSTVPFSHSVTYLPIFMAHVTVGKASLSDLHDSDAYLIHSIRVLSDFDRLDWYNCVHAMAAAYLIQQSFIIKS